MDGLQRFGRTDCMLLNCKTPESIDRANYIKFLIIKEFLMKLIELRQSLFDLFCLVADKVVQSTTKEGPQAIPFGRI